MANFNITINSEIIPSFYVEQKPVISSDCSSYYEYTVYATDLDDIDISLVGDHESETYILNGVSTPFTDSVTGIVYNTSLIVHFVIQNSGIPGVFPEATLTITNNTESDSYISSVQRLNDNVKCGANANFQIGANSGADTDVILGDLVNIVGNIPISTAVSKSFTTVELEINLDFIDDDTFATATNSNVPSSESVKAYSDNTFEPLFSKNTAFNKNFGTIAGTVVEGDDSRILNGETAFGWGNHALVGYLTSFTETDPIFIASQAFNINAGDITNLGNLSGINTGDQDLSPYQLLSEKGVANGYVPLDSGAKIDTSYLPDSVVGQVEYQGAWDASTNTPDVGDPTLSKGHYYVVSVDGTYLTIDYKVGDWIISNGVDWEKVDNTDAVTSVFGRIGAVVANSGDYAAFYEPIFSKNTGFNKDFGTIAGTVSEGNHTHTFASLTSKPTTISGYGITDFNSLGDARWLQLIGGTLSGDTYVNRGTLYGVLGVKRTLSAIEYSGGIAINGGNANPTFISSKGSFIELGDSADVNGLRYHNGSAYSIVWNSLNDGSGSGLDADLLRGVHWGNVNTDIITSGRIGVGINPLYPIHSYDSGDYKLVLEGTTNLQTNVIGFFNNGNRLGFVGTGESSNNNFDIVADNGNHMRFYVDTAIERVRINHTTGNVSIGNTNNTYKLDVSGTGKFTAEVITGVYTVATLPTGVKGARAFVSDANASTFNTIAASGGANNVPVFHDGTNWRIG